MTKKMLGILALGALLLLPGLAFGSAWEFNAPSQAFTNGNWTFGNEFQTGSAPVVVYSLGYYYDPNWGWVDSHDVAIYDTNGVLVVPWTNITLGNSTLWGHFRYTAVTPMVLAPYTKYFIEGVSYSDVYTWNDPGFVVDPSIVYLGNNWVANNGKAFNGNFLINDVADGYWGPNFNGTPEPGTFLMVGTGVLGLAGVLRRRLNL